MCVCVCVCVCVCHSAVQEARRQEGAEKHAHELQVKQAKQVTCHTPTHRDTVSWFARISPRVFIGHSG